MTSGHTTFQECSNSVITIFLETFVYRKLSLRRASDYRLQATQTTRMFQWHRSRRSQHSVFWRASKLFHTITWALTARSISWWHLEHNWMRLWLLAKMVESFLWMTLSSKQPLRYMHIIVIWGILIVILIMLGIFTVWLYKYMLFRMLYSLWLHWLSYHDQLAKFSYLFSLEQRLCSKRIPWWLDFFYSCLSE